MNIRKFIANSSQEALRMVRKEMGPDAVILESRTVSPDGGHCGYSKEKIEVTAAIDYDVTKNTSENESGLSQEIFLQKWQGLESSLKQIVDYLFTLEALNISQKGGLYNRLGRDQYIYYRHFGLEPSVIRLLSEKPEKRNPKNTKQRGSELKECLLNVIGKIKIDSEKKQIAKTRIYSFLGPTGVGKTTTMAKLAAVQAIEKGKKVALITVDTFRIGAVEQLETYARIMDIPLEIASSSKELDRAIRKYNSYDVILIDTAGRSPRKKDDVSEIIKIFQIPMDVHHFLLLSATTQLDNMLIAKQSFGALPVRSYIFTKLDEANDASAMINFLVMAKKPVSYFTTGQNVPEDIEPANRRRLAEMILKRNRWVPHGRLEEVRQYGPS